LRTRSLRSRESETLVQLKLNSNGSSSTTGTGIVSEVTTVTLDRIIRRLNGGKIASSENRISTITIDRRVRYCLAYGRVS